MRSASKYWSLYIKELKALKAPFIVLAITYVFFILYYLFVDVSHAPRNLFFYRDTLQLLILLNMLIFPGMFIYLFYDEQMNYTSHQLLSLPIPRYAVMLVKLLALLSISVAAALMISLCHYIVELKILVIADPRSHSLDHPIRNILALVAISYAMLCIANATTGILSAMKRYRIICGIFLFALFFVLYIRIIRIFIMIYDKIVFPSDFIMNAQSSNNMLFVINAVFPLHHFFV